MEDWRAEAAVAIKVAGKDAASGFLVPNYENISSPITLMGHGRSGTSLVSRVFRHHSQIDELGETANAIFSTAFMLEQIRGVTRFNDALALNTAGDLVRHTFLRMFPSQKPEWMHKPIGLPIVFQHNFGYDKLDAFVDWYWKSFYSAFPNSRTFTILRHPYDVFMSARKYWGNSEENILRSQLCVLTILSSPAAKFRAAVRYESLVSAPEETIRRLCQSVSLEFQERMLVPVGLLHAPAPDRRFGGEQELVRRRTANFTHRLDWDAGVPKSRLATEVLDKYEQTLDTLDCR